MKLNWVFDCSLLKYQSKDKNELCGPDVLYQHLILPSQFIINNNDNKDNPKNITKTFTQASLNLIASISEDQFKGGNAEGDDIINNAHASVKEEPKTEESLREKEEQRKLTIQEQLENVIRDQGRRSQGKKKRRII
ncbi:hypothetical protein K501DRAFT_284651, partial [Backusella circina FSU 941]